MLRIAGGGMNIEAYDEINPFEETIENAEEYDLDQGARIVHPMFITEKMAIRFFSMFWGREDVYARRGKNGGYFPQCDNRWDVKLCPKQRGEKIFCDECENKKWTKLDVKKIVGQLLGKEDVWDNLMRIKDHQVAAELLEIAFGSTEVKGLEGENDDCTKESEI